MKTIHIKTTQNVEDTLISELINCLIKYGFKTEKYMGINSKIIMAREKNEND